MELKEKYISKIGKNKYYLEKKSIDNFRVATYNIHYWTDVWENNTLNKIIKDIKYINADIICLQEVVFGKKYIVKGKLINTEKIIDILNNLDYYTIFCNTLPTWFGGIYGNMICVKNKYVNKIIPSNFILPKSKTSCIVSGDKEGTKETRCYIVLEMEKYIIIGLHLDVCSENQRNQQIDIIIKLLNGKDYKNKKIILLGDFNTTNINQYSDDTTKNNILKYVYNNDKKNIDNNVIAKLLKNKFRNETYKFKQLFTVWSGIQSDYIFTKNIKNTKTQILYTKSSDHLPIILDIKYRKIMRTKSNISRKYKSRKYKRRITKKR